MTKPHSDLAVAHLSNALAGCDLDVIVSGSIGAVESVRFIRALRRLSADVHPWLTDGGQQFVTPTSLSWAANQKTRTGSFAGERSHLAERDACVIAPASANFIYKIANGITDTPESALVASYLGQKKKVLVVPNMHESLFNAPAVQENLQKIQSWGVVLSAREEEGKKKFPEPHALACHVAHTINAAPNRTTVITMGRTKGYIDDVRYITNYSSGALGTAIAEDLFAHGFKTNIICGDAEIKPSVHTIWNRVETNDEMKAALMSKEATEANCGVFLASVLDFVPESKMNGKIRSSVSDLTVTFKQTEKLIELASFPKAKVGFKLEAAVDNDRDETIARDYMERYQLSMFVVNHLSKISEASHPAKLYYRDQDTSISADSKMSIASAITNHLIDRVDNTGGDRP